MKDKKELLKTINSLHEDVFHEDLKWLPETGNIEFIKCEGEDNEGSYFIFYLEDYDMYIRGYRHYSSYDGFWGNWNFIEVFPKEVLQTIYTTKE